MWQQISEFIKSTKDLSFKGVLQILLLCLIGLGTYWTYVNINTLKFMVEREQLTAREKFWNEFRLEDLHTDLYVRDVMTEARIQTGAKNVSIWGFHNGIEVGPFPFKKVSVLDESVKPGTNRVARTNQSLPLSLYVDYMAQIWKTPRNQVFAVTRDDAEQRFYNVYYDMLNYNIAYQTAYAIRISGKEAPIGLFVTHFNAREYKAMMNDPILWEKTHLEILDAAKRIEQIFNLQWNRAVESLQEN